MSTRTSRALAAILLGLGVASLGAQDHRAEAAAAAARGDVAGAADLWTKLIEAGADDQEALVEGARCLEEAGRYNDALDVLARGKRKFPDEVAFRVALARVYNRKAADLLRSLGKMDSNIVFNFQDSVREAEDLLKTWPDNRDGRLILANALYRLNQPRKAWEVLHPKVSLFPNMRGLPYLLACFASKAGLNEEANLWLARSAAMGGPSEIRTGSLEEGDLVLGKSVPALGRLTEDAAA